MEKADYLPTKLPNILTAKCPICKKKYQYLKGIKPRTCGDFNCLYAFAMKILEKRGER